MALGGTTSTLNGMIRFTCSISVENRDLDRVCPQQLASIQKFVFAEAYGNGSEVRLSPTGEEEGV